MAVLKDINIDQGTTYTEVWTIEQLTNPLLPYNASTNPYIILNLTNYTARLQVRTDFDKYTLISGLTATTENGKLVVTAVTGKITLTYLPADTTALTFKGDSAAYVYDLEIKDADGVVARVVQGAFNISREVTTYTA